MVITIIFFLLFWVSKTQPNHWTKRMHYVYCQFCFGCFAATQLARQSQEERTQVVCSTARSVEDETRNAESNGNRNSECWGFRSSRQNRENQIGRYLTVESRIEILIGFEFRGISLYKFKLRFLFDLNLQLTEISPA